VETLPILGSLPLKLQGDYRLQQSLPHGFSSRYLTQRLDGESVLVQSSDFCYVSSWSWMLFTVNCNRHGSDSGAMWGLNTKEISHTKSCTHYYTVVKASPTSDGTIQ
jgi:hypothetical protein